MNRIVTKQEKVEVDYLATPEQYTKAESLIPLHCAVAYSGFPPEDWNQVIRFSLDPDNIDYDLAKCPLEMTKEKIEKAINTIVSNRKKAYIRYD